MKSVHAPSRRVAWDDARWSGNTPTTIVSFHSYLHGDHRATVCAPVTASVRAVKRRLEDILKTPADQQRLLLGTGRDLVSGGADAGSPSGCSGDETLLGLGRPTHMLLESVSHDTRTPGTAQLYTAVQDEAQKLESLRALLRALDPAQWVIYCNNRHRATWLLEHLRGDSVPAAAYHGDMDERERDLVLDRFHARELSRIVLTDSMCPYFLGHMEQVPIIVNYDFPPNVDDYGRRVFRTGRFATRAVAISLVLPLSRQYLRDAGRYFSTEIRELPLEHHLMIASQVAAAREGVPEGHAERFHRREIRQQATGC